MNSQGTVIWVRLSLHGMTALRTCARGGQIFYLCGWRFGAVVVWRLEDGLRGLRAVCGRFAGGLWTICGWFVGDLRVVCEWFALGGLRAFSERFAGV